ncbi:MAG TPA: acetate/propionate family kinase [Opitutaceae bacterium]|jgi:acetate kinase
MNILTINAGSGSQRCSLFQLEGPLPPTWECRDPVREIAVDSTAPGQPLGQLNVKCTAGGRSAVVAQVPRELPVGERTKRLLRFFWEGEGAPLKGPGDVEMAGHRIVHGGDRFDCAVEVDAQMEAAIERFSAYAPLHNPNNLAAIRATRDVCGRSTRQVAVFDTAFHRTLPRRAAVYAGPREWEREGIRRYGFHGTNYRGLAGRAAHLLRREGDPDLRLILCHIGGGASVCAVRGGMSIDTTMGLTPLDGLAMATRSGAIDPGIVILLQKKGKSADEIERLLNKESGLKGLSEISGDTRDLLPLAKTGHDGANLALDVFVYRWQCAIGQMLAALEDRPHAIVFSDAIAESDPELREAACRPFKFLGLQVDTEKNTQLKPDGDFASAGSKVRALLIKSREAWQIARERAELADEGGARGPHALDR